MNKLLVVLLMISPLIASAQAFDVTTKTGTVYFTYDGGTKGTLGDVSATISFDVSDLSKGSISGSVNVSTLDTGNKMRNKHLKGKDYFDIENYPTMTFKSTSISQEENVYTIKGKLKIKSTEKEVTFLAFNNNGKMTFSAMIYGSDFDVAISKKREKTMIEIYVSIPL